MRFFWRQDYPGVIIKTYMFYNKKIFLENLNFEKLVFIELKMSKHIFLIEKSILPSIFINKKKKTSGVNKYRRR